MKRQGMRPDEAKRHDPTPFASLLSKSKACTPTRFHPGKKAATPSIVLFHIRDYSYI